jgi:hypothetical protein
MDLDAEFGIIFAELPQSKVSAVKLVAFMTSNINEPCFYACLGDYLVICTGSRRVYEEGEPAWAFPSLENLKSAGVVLSGHMKALQAKGAELLATIPAKFVAHLRAISMSTSRCAAPC